ncbi:restriction endonuclease, partial [Bacillus thuringiensis]
WLHSFYYFNDGIPSEDDFYKTVANYLTFQFDMTANGKGYLFEGVEENE